MSDAVLSQFTPTVRDEAKDTGRVLKFGIIGTGWIAESYIESIKEIPYIKVTAAADLIPGKADKFFKHYGVEGVRLYPDHKAMLEAETDLDAVCVCTYNTEHASCTIDALNKGINVILEKPMTVTLDEAADIIRAERKSGKLLSIGFQPRLDENMKMIKKIVDSGALGRVYYIQTGGGRR
ncbi:MAG: Gfo/Idh/MocA family oxidoreductase, partial [Oscillospiraceae bacterium]|nr:Gfo/Idh/MocA family oxidoreductase [Oscillospiraceae bacterium]